MPKRAKSLLTPQLQEYFKDYSAYHKTLGNKVTHYIGIPMILVTLLGLLSRLEFLGINAGIVLLVAGGLRYFFLDWKISIPFSFILVGCYFLGTAIPMGLSWGFFALGWIFQGVGHAVYEKKSPAFFKNLNHVLIGPLWIFAKVIRYQ